MAARAMSYCKHRLDLPLFPHTLIYYCATLSTIFVLSLYVFVPQSIRRLPRDHVLHIQWRTGIIMGVCLVAVLSYPKIYCRVDVDRDDSVAILPWYRFLGVSWNIDQDIKIVAHVFVLYLGSFATSWVKIYHSARINHWKEESHKYYLARNRRDGSPVMNRTMSLLPKPKHLYQSFRTNWVHSTIIFLRNFFQNSPDRWTKLRNYFIAPLSEEIIFRACLLPPLLASSKPTINNSKNKILALSPIQASWIAPLFFGIAHLHHIYEQWRHLNPSLKTTSTMVRLLAGVMFQWGYTTLFGAYASHVFLRTASLSGVVLAHMACNYMGLPDFRFVQSTSGYLYDYRWFLGIMYLIGILLFILGFGFGESGEWLESRFFPKESVLLTLLHR
mmetsp:Transcript_11147/g.21674  ORF Transcript_11147/g.21674 Transcript_11147/m.21674 type:complete len:387 (+) Transcript_11147:119-1279(+)